VRRRSWCAFKSLAVLSMAGEVGRREMETLNRCSCSGTAELWRYQDSWAIAAARIPAHSATRDR
jgi:hypothetical protein